jgi:hypothetical protein
MMHAVMKRWHSWHDHFYHQHRPAHPVLVVGHIAYALEPNRRIRLMATINTVGSAPLNLTIAFLDQHGQPMQAAPKPDAVPTWTNTTPADETIAPSADGLSCTATAVAPGLDEIDVSVVVGGVTFKAALPVGVAPAAQVLTSVEIVPAV